MPYTELLNNTITNENESLGELSKKQPILLVFLRHFGCVFCREAMQDIGKKRDEWEKTNVKVVLVHMSDHDTANSYFEKYNLKGVSNISNPDTSLYAKFGLLKGKPSQLMGLKNFFRGFEVTLGKGIPLALKFIGDGFQMPGVFFIRNGKVVNSFIHKNAADVPDYDGIISCCGDV